MDTKETISEQLKRGPQHIDDKIDDFLRDKGYFKSQFATLKEYEEAKEKIRYYIKWFNRWLLDN